MIFNFLYVFCAVYPHLRVAADTSCACADCDEAMGQCRKHSDLIIPKAGSEAGTESAVGDSQVLETRELVILERFDLGVTGVAGFSVFQNGSGFL
jgi:hypothetical protein